MLLAQITDMHLGLDGSKAAVRFQTPAHLDRAVAHLGRLDPLPDAVLCTGDLVDEGTPEEYARLVEVLGRLPMPWYVVPGNHDHRENLRAALRSRGYLPERGFLCYAVDAGPLRLIGLDTIVPGEDHGLLCAERLGWLEARLAEAPARPTILFMHHPPFKVGIEAIDAMGLEGSGALAEIVARHPQVERVLCGHLHRPIVKRFAGTVASVCPSTAHQLRLDLRRGEPMRLVDDPPACQLHLWDEVNGLVTHTSYIRD